MSGDAASSTNRPAISNEQATQLFEAGAIFLLSDLPKGSTFGIDTKLWTVARFGGVKFLPPGLHLIVTGAASSNADPETLSSAIGVRHGLLRFVAAGEVIVRRWSAEDESIHSEGRSTKRRRIAEDVTEIVSRDQLKSIDSTLAPYPFEALEEWRRLTSTIDERCIGRVIGFDERGDAMVDAITAAIGDLDVGRAEDEPLRFADFDLKRSWPEGAVGEDVSRHSRDKSWLLGHVVSKQLDGDERQLLAELSLSFVLLTIVQNFAALEAYRRLLSLLCRSIAALSERPALFEALLSDVLPTQLESLDPEFFNDMSELETFYLTELAVLSATIKTARRRGPAVEKIAAAWQRLAALSSDRFGWSLASIEADEERMKPGTTRYNLLSQESEDEAEEDMPVFVTLDDEPAPDRLDRWRAQAGFDDEDGAVRLG